MLIIKIFVWEIFVWKIFILLRKIYWFSQNHFAGNQIRFAICEVRSENSYPVQLCLKLGFGVSPRQIWLAFNTFLQKHLHQSKTFYYCEYFQCKFLQTWYKIHFPVNLITLSLFFSFPTKVALMEPLN